MPPMIDICCSWLVVASEGTAAADEALDGAKHSRLIATALRVRVRCCSRRDGLTRARGGVSTLPMLDEPPTSSDIRTGDAVESEKECVGWTSMVGGHLCVQDQERICGRC